MHGAPPSLDPLQATCDLDLTSLKLISLMTWLTANPRPMYFKGDIVFRQRSDKKIRMAKHGTEQLKVTLK